MTKLTAKKRFEQIRDNPHLFPPSPETLRSIGHKTLVMIVGPDGVGKTTLVDTLTARYPEIGGVRSFTTRQPRPDDHPATIECFPRGSNRLAELCDLIEAGRAVSLAPHPTNGELYGTLDSSYPHDICALPTLASSVDTYRQIPFGNITLIGLVAEPHDWKQWLRECEFTSDDERNARLAEAAMSLEWLVRQRDCAFVVNRPNDQEATAAEVYNIVRTGRHTDGIWLADRMLVSTELMLNDSWWQRLYGQR